MASLSQLNRSPGSDSHFTQTIWGEIHLAKAGDEAARESLVRRYWYPLYAFLRRQGRTREDAQDMVQGFFAYLLSRPDLGSPDSSRGRFRTFLLTWLTGYVRDQWRKGQAAKRGRGLEFVPWDGMTAEEMYVREPSTLTAPEKLFDHTWAMGLLAEARGKVRTKWIQGAQADYFDFLEPTLEGGQTLLSYAAIAAKFNKSEGAVKKAVHDLRKAYRHQLLALLRSERGDGPDSKQDAEDLKDLYSALADTT